MQFRSTTFALLLACTACGDNLSAAQPDAGVVTPDAPPAFAEAPHPAVPQMISDGGHTLATPRIVPIFFTGDATVQAQIEMFASQLATSTYWSATSSEYGVGPLTVASTIVSTDAAPTSYDALTTWLAAQLDGTHAGWDAAADPNTIYSVFLPSGVQFSTPFGNACEAFGAFHDEAVGAHGESLIFALMPRCGGLDSLTVATSHEFVEAVTDPTVETMPAFGDIDAAHEIWGFTPGAEVGDMCEYVHEAPQRLVGNFLVQRTWSNASALAGHDPCVPVMNTPYVNAAPVLPDDAMVDTGMMHGMISTKGIVIPVGTSKTIEVDLFSDQDAADWTVAAFDAASQVGGGSAELVLTLDKSSGHNGDKLQLTITHKKAGALGGSEFLLSSKVNNSSVGQWWGYVSN